MASIRRPHRWGYTDTKISIVIFATDAETATIAHGGLWATADQDNNGDGILDVDHKCPNNAETFNNYEDDDGCPDDSSPDIPKFINIIFQFATDRIVGADHVPVLDYIAQVMQENPDMRLQITGHTDNIGAESSNMNLSEKRAKAVLAEFVKLGVDEGRVDLDWKGESEPIDTNDTEEGRQRNRRIEFTVLEE